MQKKLYRSRENKSLSGVCGGLGEYLNMDPTVVRVLWVILSLFTTGFPGLILYIIMACVIPEAPEQPEQPAAWQQPYAPPYAPPPQGWQQQPPQGTWQAPPPAPPMDYTQPAPPEPVDPPSE